MIELAGLDLVEGDYHVLEEDYVFFSEGHCESTDDRSKDVEQFGHSVELVGVVDQSQETVSYGLPDHLPPGNQFSIKSMEDVLHVLPFFRLFTVE